MELNKDSTTKKDADKETVSATSVAETDGTTSTEVAPPKAANAEFPSDGMPVSTAGKSPIMGSFWERFVALFIDGLIVGAIYFFLFMVVGLLLGFLLGVMFGSSSDSEAGAIVGMFLSLLIWVIFAVLVFGYYVYFYSQKGQTPGKKLMKLKVVSSENFEYLTPGKAFLRQLFEYFISPWLLYLGYLWFFMSERRQTWHDSVANSYVVKTDDAGVILYGGPDTYPKEPVKTFAPMGCYCLFVVVFFILFFTVFAAIIASIPPDANVGDSGLDPYGTEYDYDYDIDGDYNYEYEYDSDYDSGDVPADMDEGTDLEDYDLTEEELEEINRLFEQLDNLETPEYETQ